jgi:polyhydroxybutyrate depolymerase
MAGHWPRAVALPYALLLLSIVAPSESRGQEAQPLPLPPPVSPSPSPSPSPAQPGAGRFDLAMELGGHHRRFVVYVPRGYQCGQPLPLVVVLHASMGSADSLLDDAGWPARAEASGFLVLAPEGLPLHPGAPAGPVVNPRVWNSGQYGDSGARAEIDDVGFVVAAIDRVMASWSVDPRRVYATGHSNGGAMAFRLGAERADRFTAIASVGGLCWVADPRPSRPIPTLFIAGKLDPVVPLRGGLKVLPWEMKVSPPVSRVLDRWAVAIGCAPTPHPVDWPANPGVELFDYTGWNGSLLRVMYVKNQGHNWPGSKAIRPERVLGPDLSTLDATAEVWSFFSQWSW